MSIFTGKTSAGMDGLNLIFGFFIRESVCAVLADAPCMKKRSELWERYN